MPKQNDYTLNQTELEQIQVAMRSRTAKVVKRATIVHGLHLGHCPDELAQLHDVSLTTIYNHVDRFKADDEAGLADKGRSGRPRKATAAYIQLLEETLDIDPKEQGYAFTMWTQSRLRSYLAQETGIDLGRSVFQELMQQLGYRYRRPKRDLGHEQDADLRDPVKDALEELKKEPKQEKSSYFLWMKPPSD
jgi:transposase